MIQIQPASPGQIPLIRELACKIWPATYAHILSREQIDYMMERIYSTESLRRQMDEQHHVFLILEAEGRPAGFASYSIYPGGEKAKLQKIYVDPALQGMGLGRLLLNEVSARAQAAGCSVLRLNVNRHNQARSFYERQGFSVTGEEDIDIGNGFWMNDFVMEKQLVVV
jgi:ribosomal protein S18 acetylase RimI-like enzyme